VDHFHIGFFEFLVFLLYYFMAKALILVMNIELRRHKVKTGAAVTGLLS
jgi:hypothetical protein